MAKAPMEKRQCERCQKTINIDNFYVSKRTDKYPDNGVVNKCKSCYTAHINNWEPSTFQSLLEDIDVPYIPSEWNGLLERYGADPKKTSTMAIFGRYLSKMKLKQYSDYGYADTEKIAGEAAKKVQLAAAREEAHRLRYQTILGGEVPTGQIQTDISLLNDDDLAMLFAHPEEIAKMNEGFASADAQKAIAQQNAMPSLEDQVSLEDRLALKLKWGKLYSIEELLTMEKLYRDMMESYEITTASHIDYLKKICKTSVKFDQALDVNDTDGMSKLQKAYDSLMKSANFTAAQNKSAAQNDYEAVCELIVMCEERGFIPRFDLTVERDIADITLGDMKRYTHTLITQEQGLGNLIETAIAAMMREEEKEDEELALVDDLDTLLDLEHAVVDEDYEEFGDFVEGLRDE